jgi:acyl dehydratase
MPVNTATIGKSFPTDLYAVGREKIREYAAAVGETDPLYHDLEAARAAGYADLVAPPMFAVVYSSRPSARLLFDPEIGMNFSRLVHGGQEFAWGELVVAGDEISTTATLTGCSERAGLEFYVAELVSENQRGEPVCTGTWTFIVRGEES